MKKIYKKYIAVFFAAIMLSVSVSGCHSTKNEQNDEKKESKIEKKDDENISVQEKLDQVIHITENPDPNATPAPQKETVSSENIYKMGEEVTECSVSNGEDIPDAFVYTVKKAKAYGSFADAGVSKENIVDEDSVEDLLDKDGNMKPNVKFIVVEMSVKNVKARVSEKNITSVVLRYDVNGKAASEGKVELGILEMPAPYYFSNSIGREGAKDYYGYSLPYGRSKNLKIGWCIDTERYNLSNFYFVIDSEKFIKLEIE